MSPVPVFFEPKPEQRITDHAPPSVQLVDVERGTWAMYMVIFTETMLFVMLFFAYFYIAKGNERWNYEVPPRLHYAIPMLGVLFVANVFLWFGERQTLKGHIGAARALIVPAIVLGLGYFALAYFDNTEHLLTLTARSDAYGSIFYTITSLHGVHIALGVLMLFWLLFLRQYEPVQRPPHRPYHNIAVYWYWLTLVWLAILAILYIGPVVYNAM